MLATITGISTAVSTAITGLSTEVIAIAATGLGIGGVILAFKLGWRVFKGMAH